MEIFVVMVTWDKLSIAIEQVLLFSISFEQAVNLQAYLEIIMGVCKPLLNYVRYLCPLIAEDHNVMSSFLVHLPRFSHRVKAKLKAKAIALENGWKWFAIIHSEWHSICIYLNRCDFRFHFRSVWTGLNVNKDAVHVDDWVHIPLSVILTSTFFNQVWRWTISVQSLISTFSFNWFIFYFNVLLESFRIDYQTWIYNQKNIFPSVVYDLRHVCIVFGRDLLAFIYILKILRCFL